HRSMEEEEAYQQGMEDEEIMAALAYQQEAMVICPLCKARPLHMHGATIECSCGHFSLHTHHDHRAIANTHFSFDCSTKHSITGAVAVRRIAACALTSRLQEVPSTASNDPRSLCPLLEVVAVGGGHGSMCNQMCQPPLSLLHVPLPTHRCAGDSGASGSAAAGGAIHCQQLPLLPLPTPMPSYLPTPRCAGDFGASGSAAAGGDVAACCGLPCAALLHTPQEPWRATVSRPSSLTALHPLL
ncbi:unnamed protein product, partial [Closterium sp. NIES-64]